jgi:hypothetical protein
VLRKDGIFVYNDWRMKDVPPHKAFGEILQQHRTNNPSRTLKLQRTALAVIERSANRELNLDAQLRGLRRLGFKEVEVKPRNYKIILPSIGAYLDMRLKRATLKQELKELSSAERERMLHAFKEGLAPFVRGGRFLLNWKVTFVKARKT